MQSLQQAEVHIPYWPHAAQVPFHLDRYRVKFRLLSGGTGSGKTIAGVFEMTDYLLENDGAVGFIFEPTFPMVRRNLIAQGLQELLGKRIAANPLVETYMKTEHRIDFRNGSRLWFGSLEEPEYAEGSNVDFIMVDEARLIRHFEEAWRSLQRRLRGSIPGKYPVGAYVTTTPDAPNSFMHSFFENPKTRDPQSKVYRMSLYDNVHLTKDYIASIERSHHKGRADRFIHGRFAAIGAGTIPFDYAVHVEPFKACKPPRFKEMLYGVDFGWTNPSAILAVGFDGDGRAFVLGEVYRNHLSHNQLLEEAKEMRDLYGRGVFYCDRSEPETIEFFNSHGVSARGSKARRDESIREMAGRFPACGDGKPRIFISPSCVNLIAELQIYNEQIKEQDHAVDALRYALARMMKAHVKAVVSKSSSVKTTRRRRARW